MYLGLDINIGSLSPLFEGESLDTNSGNPVNIALPKLQRETDSASTPASKLLSDYTIAEVANNSNRIDESVLKADFCNTLDKICQEEHHQNCEELSKQSLENVLEFQGRVDEDFIKEKVSDIDIGSLLFAGELLDTNSGDPVNIALPKLQRETNSALSKYGAKRIVTAQNLVGNFTETPQQPSKINTDFPENAFLPPNFEQLQRICLPDQNTMNSFSECNVSQVSEQQKTDSASTPASNLLSDYTIGQVKNNSNRIDESVLKEDFYNTLDKKCQKKHHQNFEELSKQSLKKALKFQGSVYEDFTEKKAKLSEKQLVSTDRYEYPCIVTDCSFTHKDRIIMKRHLFKHIKVSPYYCEQCLPYTFFARDAANLNEHKRVHLLDTAILKPVQNINNSNRIDESVLKEDFYRTLDKKCQEKHHQNFEEFSKQSLKNALEFLGRVYQDFTKEKAKLSEKQLISTDRYGYSCIVTDCPFTHRIIAVLQAHLFKHTKVSQYYCEQCFPNIFFVRDKTELNLHIKRKHATDSTSTPASKLLSDYTIAQVENNSNRIDESVLKTYFHNVLDKVCQEVHHQNFEELSKQSLKNALEFQSKVYKNFVKAKVELSEKQLVSPDSYEYPCIVTNCSFTQTRKSDIRRHLFKHIKVSQHYCEQCFPDIYCAQNKTDLDKHKRSVHFSDRAISKRAKRGINRIHQPVQNTINGSNGFTVNQVSDPGLNIGSLPPLFEGELLDTNSGDPVNIALPKLQQKTDSASTPASKLLSDYTIAVTAQSLVGNFTETPQQPSKINTDFPENAFLPPNFEQLPIAEVENNSNRIDESVLKTDFYKTLDKICQEVHHQNFEELSKQSLKNALELQGSVYQDFTKKKARLSEKQLEFTDRYGYSCIVTNCSFTGISRSGVQVHLFKHIKVSQHYCEQCFPNIFLARDKTDLDKHKRSVHFSDRTISKRGINRIYQRVQNTINGSNGFTVDQVSDPWLSCAKQAKIDP